MMERVRITSVGRRGDGFAEAASGRLHVPFTVPGDLIEVERDGERGVVRALIEPGAGRADPVCRHFGVCGGCATQHWDLQPYFAWKHNLVVSALARAGVEAPVSDIVDAHGAGRRRAVFHAAQDGGEITAGFSERRSHRIVAIEECPVLMPELVRALPVARKFARALAPLKKPIDLQFTATENGLDLDLRGARIGGKAEATLIALAREQKLARLTQDGAQMALLAEPAIRVGKARVVLPPASFLQATESGERALADKVLAAAQGAKQAADLFCGVGAFALRLAERAKVSAFDSSAPAVAALTAAAKAPGLKPVVAQARDLFRWPLVAEELKNFDFVVLDPPRQGAEAQARELARSKVKRVAYASCDPETFARDAKILCGAGFTLREVTPVDQFRYSPHVELVGVFGR